MYRVGAEGQSAKRDGRRSARMSAATRPLFARIHGKLAMKRPPRTGRAPSRSSGPCWSRCSCSRTSCRSRLDCRRAARWRTSTREALLMLQDYARHHVLLCLVPALFIAGAIACFVSAGGGDEVLRRAGPQGRSRTASRRSQGTILAACSCTILPLFAGIYKRGAGLGPATAFLYSGPAINVLAIVLTARVLGLGARRRAGGRGDRLQRS
jgi:uncharacterized membrane protein YraQ (UPF0718 family)